MTEPDVLQLYPGTARTVPLKRLYLTDGLRPAGSPAHPFVYANFITSLDGRISLPDPTGTTRKAPAAITNSRDWRLFQELVACADVVVTSGRYMRDLAAGVAQSNVPVSQQPEFADLINWRISQGRTPQPAVAIVSSSLDFTIPDGVVKERTVYVVTGTINDYEKAEVFRKQGVRVLSVSEGAQVTGAALIAALAGEGFGNIEMIGGAVLLRMLLAENAFDRLYLTRAHRFLGGRSFDTVLNGDVLIPPTDFRLRALFQDTGGTFEQSFAVYDCGKAGG